MDFTLSEEQSLLQHSVDQFVARARSRPGTDDDAWDSVAQLGWLAVGLPEAAGGIGGAVEAMLVSRGLGRALVTAPFVPTVVLGAALLARLGTPEQAALVDRVTAGGLKLAVAVSEPPDGFCPARPRTTAERHNGAFTLHGRKNTVLGAPEADVLLVPAVLDGAVSVFLLRPAAPGLQMRNGRLADGRGVADLLLDGAEADGVLGGAAVGAEVLAQVIDSGVAATCADAVGAMGEALRITVEHLRTRRQFGAPLASFQVLQHRIVDMRMEWDHAGSLTEAAAMACDGPDAAQRTRLVSAAKARVAKAARFVGEQSIQLHGGIGMTAEHEIGRYYKRLLGDEMLFGDRMFHLDRLAGIAA